MLKYYSLLIGENPAYTKLFQPSSKRKIALYANCMMIPVVLWFVNAFLLVREVLGGSLFTATVAAILAGFIILLIERAIIMSNGSTPIFWFRIVLGLIIASLGSISMDEVIFKHDIDNQVAVYRNKSASDAVKSIDDLYSIQVASQKAIVSKKASDWNEALSDAKREADGTGGSRQLQVGKIALLKMGVASSLESDYQAENTKLNDLESNLDNQRRDAKMKAESEFKENAILIRIRALFDLIAQDKFMLFVYLLFTMLLFCIEFLVVLVKICTKNSIDEDLEKSREALLRLKTQKILDRSDIYFKPENLEISVQQANAIIKRNKSTIF